QANKVKVTFAKVESSDNITEDQKPGNDQIKEELPQTGSNVNSASMGILGLTSLLGGLFIKKNR
ncbi:LPXTG cell wall anchor domain-containing protein, partial [Clostridium perfringens]